MLVDTSILVELLGRPATDTTVRRIVDAVRDEILFASPIQLGEIADAARAARRDVASAVQQARELVELIPLEAEIAVEGSNLKAQARKSKVGRDFSLIDGIILASARAKGQRVLTLDAEYSGFDDVTVLPR